MKTVKTITVIEKDGKYWGVQYADGYSTSYGWGPYENATIVDRRYCKTPEYATYKGSHYVPELRKGRLLDIEVTTIIREVK